MNNLKVGNIPENYVGRELEEQRELFIHYHYIQILAQPIKIELSTMLQVSLFFFNVQYIETKMEINCKLFHFVANARCFTQVP